MNAKHPLDYHKVFGRLFINPADKFSRGVGFGNIEVKFNKICTLGAEQLLKCYQNLDEQLCPEQFKTLCSHCVYSENPVSYLKGNVMNLINARRTVKTRQHNSFVYFVSDGEFIKIGKAKNYEARLGGIQTGNARKCYFVALIPCETESDSNMLETELHRYFSHKRMIGEWFDIIDDPEFDKVVQEFPAEKEMQETGRMKYA